MRKPRSIQISSKDRQIELNPKPPVPVKKKITDFLEEKIGKDLFTKSAEKVDFKKLVDEAWKKKQQEALPIVPKSDPYGSITEEAYKKLVDEYQKSMPQYPHFFPYWPPTVPEPSLVWTTTTDNTNLPNNINSNNMYTSSPVDDLVWKQRAIVTDLFSSNGLPKVY